MPLQKLQCPLAAGRQDVQSCSTRSVVPGRVLYKRPVPPQRVQSPLPLQALHFCFPPTPADACALCGEVSPDSVELHGKFVCPRCRAALAGK